MTTFDEDHVQQIQNEIDRLRKEMDEYLPEGVFGMDAQQMYAERMIEYAQEICFNRKKLAKAKLQLKDDEKTLYIKRWIQVVERERESNENDID